MFDLSSDSLLWHQKLSAPTREAPLPKSSIPVVHIWGTWYGRESKSGRTQNICNKSGRTLNTCSRLGRTQDTSSRSAPKTENLASSSCSNCHFLITFEWFVHIEKYIAHMERNKHLQQCTYVPMYTDVQSRVVYNSNPQHS